MNIIQRDQNRRGATMALFLVLLPILILIVGFSIDYAHMQRTRTELRRATDLAAKAAALSLSVHSDEAIAREAANDVAMENFVADAPLELAYSDIVFGSSTQNGDGTYGFTAGGTPTNAVRILGDRSMGSPSGPIATYFGSLYNSPNFEPQFSATAAFVNTDICLVLDRSSSMKLAVTNTEPGMFSTDPRACAPPYADSRWVALEVAVASFLDEMDTSSAAEQVGMITFASDFTNCGTTTPRVSVDQTLTGFIGSVRAAMANRTSTIWGGNTDIASGIEEAQLMLTGPSSRSTADKFMIVMTDGRYTEANPVPYAQIAAANGITIHTITFGEGANQTDMQAVADAGNGVHYHADDLADLIQVFRDLGGSLSNLVQ